MVGRARVEFGEEESSEVDGAGAGDGLEACGLDSVSGCYLAFQVVVLTRFSWIAGLSAPSMSF